MERRQQFGIGNAKAALLPYNTIAIETRVSLSISCYEPRPVTGERQVDRMAVDGAVANASYGPSPTA